ncbi:MAG: myo-inositol 2-dehydrogenase / D-chiro-inositol 1-dehydrogenase [Acidimicrobiaceae bacterium]|nr:myo-inositol 2-dehydrogenase / D-chiro-inositol 1-dehydrogenase [Acidimicrobiaceae bacterium]
MTVLRIAIVGYGRMGRRHAATIARLPHVEIRAIVDPVVRSSDPHDLPIRELDAVLEDPSIDAAIVASSTDAHARLIDRLIAAGKPTFCEKPLAASTTDAEQLVAAASDAGVPLTVGFNRRFDPDVAELRQRIAEGEVGRVESLHFISHDATPPSADYAAASGGLFHDMSIHDFDLARFLTGGEVAQVSAFAGRSSDAAPATEVDVAVTTLLMDDDTIVQINNSRHCAAGYDQRIEAFGSRGSLAMASRPTSAVRVANEAGFRYGPLSPGFLQRYDTAYGIEIEAWVRSVREQAEPWPSGWDALEASRVADAAAACAATRTTTTPSRPDRRESPRAPVH